MYIFGLASFAINFITFFEKKLWNNFDTIISIYKEYKEYSMFQILQKIKKLEYTDFRRALMQCIVEI